MNCEKAVLGPVHTYPDIFESATFSFRIRKYPRPHVMWSQPIHVEFARPHVFGFTPDSLRIDKIVTAGTGSSRSNAELSRTALLSYSFKLFLLDTCGRGLRTVFKSLSKVITWLRLLRLVIVLKDSGQFFSQWEAKPKPKPIAPCTRHFSRALSKFQIIARNYDWFIAPFGPVVIGRSNCSGFFRQSFENRSMLRDYGILHYTWYFPR